MRGIGKGNYAIWQRTCQIMDDAGDLCNPPRSMTIPQWLRKSVPEIDHFDIIPFGPKEACMNAMRNLYKEKGGE